MAFEKRALPSLTSIKRVIGNNFEKFAALVTGSATISVFPDAASNNIAAAAGGAISVANYLTTINTDAGGDAFTLADGTQDGQMKKILLVVDGGGNAVITGAYEGGNTLTLANAAEFAVLRWNGARWRMIDQNGAVISTV